jgi:hypothetical protein
MFDMACKSAVPDIEVTDNMENNNDEIAHSDDSTNPVDHPKGKSQILENGLQLVLQILIPSIAKNEVLSIS